MNGKIANQLIKKFPATEINYINTQMIPNDLVQLPLSQPEIEPIQTQPQPPIQTLSNM